MSGTHHYGSNKGSKWFGDLIFDLYSKVKINTQVWVKDISTPSPSATTELVIPILKKTTTPGEFLTYTPYPLNNVMTDALVGYYCLNADQLIPSFGGSTTRLTYSPKTVQTPTTTPHPHLTSSSPGLFEVQRAGIYIITADTVWASSATSAHRFTAINIVSGGNPIANLSTNSQVNPVGQLSYNGVQLTRFLQVGDSFEIVCGQTAGVAQTAVGFNSTPANPSDIIITSLHTPTSF